MVVVEQHHHTHDHHTPCFIIIITSTSSSPRRTRRFRCPWAAPIIYYHYDEDNRYSSCAQNGWRVTLFKTKPTIQPEYMVSGGRIQKVALDFLLFFGVF